MPIRTRITGLAERANILRNTKKQHPLLRAGSKHRAIWQLLVQDGNKAGGMTAAQMRARSPFYHPQVLKDLIDHRLVAKRGKNENNEVRYVADDAGRGTYMQEVTVEVELLEDEKGKFVTRTTLIGRQGDHGRIIRSLGRRKIHFTVPLPHEEGVEQIVGFVNVDNADGFNSTPGQTSKVTKFIAGEAERAADTLLLEGDYAIIKE